MRNWFHNLWGGESTYGENLEDIDTCESQFFMSAVDWKWHRNVAEVLGEQGDQGTGPSGHGKEEKKQWIHFLKFQFYTREKGQVL